jgi:hypothetical protein
MWDDAAIRSALAGEDTGRAVAAAEAVAAAAGHPGDALTNDARAWVESHGVPSDELVELALRRVKDLCAQETEATSLEELRDLRFRLGDAAAP